MGTLDFHTFGALQMRKIGKRGQMGLDNIPSVVITLGLIAIILGVMATVLSKTQSTQCVNSGGATYVYANSTCYRVLDAENKTLSGTLAWNVSGQGLTAQKTLSDWQGTFAVIAGAAVVIGLVAGFLMLRRG